MEEVLDEYEDDFSEHSDEAVSAYRYAIGRSRTHFEDVSQGYYGSPAEFAEEHHECRVPEDFDLPIDWNQVAEQDDDNGMFLFVSFTDHDWTSFYQKGEPCHVFLND